MQPPALRKRSAIARERGARRHRRAAAFRSGTGEKRCRQAQPVAGVTCRLQRRRIGIRAPSAADGEAGVVASGKVGIEADMATRRSVEERKDRGSDARSAATLATAAGVHGAARCGMGSGRSCKFHGEFVGSGGRPPKPATRDMLHRDKATSIEVRPAFPVFAEAARRDPESGHARANRAIRTQVPRRKACARSR